MTDYVVIVEGDYYDIISMAMYNIDLWQKPEI